MKCDNCYKEQNLDEPFWTSRKTGIALMVCAQCLYELDGIDKRGKSVAQDLRDIETRRRKEQYSS